ncbi:hypothetical protein [Streptomyces laurentii]|uniref:hypothetical protein n=1 Tax=Streptomyces laurentii TaxID=39478 RepID=UPI003697CA1C
MIGPSGTSSTAMCPAGETVEGGGYDASALNIVNVNHPIAGGWQAAGELIGSVQAYVICAPPV